VSSNLQMCASLDLLRLRLRDVARFRLRDMVTGSPALRELSPELARAMEARRREFMEETQAARSRLDLSAHMARGLVRYLTREYQYLHLGNERQSEISGLYALFLDQLRASDRTTEAAISRHHDRLRLLVRGALEEAGALARILEEPLAPVCATYSPGFQLQLLGLDPDRLAGPVLDLGCGPDGNLVTHLRGTGRRDVFGVDQNAGEAEGVFRGSWFEAPLASGTWGTVIAHQSFSLHFAHAHLRSEKQAKAYARTYMRILESLKPDGCFAYAPGLPFFERLLPAEWHVRTRPLPGAGQLSAIENAASVVISRTA